MVTNYHLLVSSKKYSLSVLFEKFYFLELGPEHKKIWPFTGTMLKTLNSNFPCLQSLTSGTTSDFGIMLPLVPVVKIVKKIGHRENLGAGVKLLRDLTEKSVNFSTLATSNIKLFLVFEEDR